MKKWKLLVLLLIMAIFAGLLASCKTVDPANTQGEDLASSYDPDDTTPATLRLSTWWGGKTFKTLKTVIDEFVAENPHITVEPLLWPYGGDYQQKLVVSSAGGEQPDIITMVDTDFPRFWFGGILEPLDFYLDALAYDTDRWLSGVRETHTYDGKIVAMPLHREQRVTCYNADLFREAGLPNLPDLPTWDDIEHAAKTISEMGTNAEGEQVFGVRIHPDYFCSLGIYLNDMGLPIEGDTNSAKFNTPERIDAAKRIFGIARTYAPPAGLTFEPMYTGVLGMDIGQPTGFVNELGGDVNFELRIVNFPVVDASKGQFVAVTCNSLGIGNQSKYKSAAAKLLAKLSSPEAEERLKAYVLTPTTGAVYDELLEPKDKFPFDGFCIINPQPDARFSVMPKFDWISNASASYMSVLNGDMSVEDYFIEAQENIDYYLSQPDRNPLDNAE